MHHHHCLRVQNGLESGTYSPTLMFGEKEGRGHTEKKMGHTLKFGEANFEF